MTTCSKRKVSMKQDCAACSSFSEFSACSKVVTQACCGGPGDKCVGGQPKTCDSECDDILIPMQKLCDPFLHKTPGVAAIATELANAVKSCPHSSDTERIAGYTRTQGWCIAASGKYTNRLDCPRSTAKACAALCTNARTCSGFSTDQRGACSLSVKASAGVRTCRLSVQRSWTFNAAVKGDGLSTNGNTCFTKTADGH